jgi:hypothetical protein
VTRTLVVMALLVTGYIWLYLAFYNFPNRKKH